MMLVYRILFYVFFTPVILILSVLSPKVRAGFKQKFGCYDFKNEAKTLWVHAVSVGEVQAISGFIKNNKKKKITLTTSTPQGQKLAKEKLSEYCEKICYFPYDYDFAVKNAIEAVNPEKVMIVETEIWANFVRLLKQAKIPVVVANGRISDSTYKSYRLLKWFFKDVFKNYEQILAQSEDDAKRFIKIGAPKSIVSNMGNIKFDIPAPDKKIKEGLKTAYNKGDTKLIVAGSTHFGEEKIIIDAFLKLKDVEHGGNGYLKLVLAPRHLERVKYVAGILEKLKVNFSLKTQSADLSEFDVIILDTTGELANLYSICDVAILGGSFNNTGGHNPLEATIWGKPVISGANVKNFRVIYRELTKYGCARIVKNKAQLHAELEKLLVGYDGEKIATEMEQNCTKVMSKNRGALRVLESYL